MGMGNAYPILHSNMNTFSFHLRLEFHVVLRLIDVSCSVDVTVVVMADDNYCEYVAGTQVVRCYCQVLFDTNYDYNDNDFAGFQAYSQ